MIEVFKIISQLGIRKHTDAHGKETYVPVVFSYSTKFFKSMKIQASTGKTKITFVPEDMRIVRRINEYLNTFEQFKDVKKVFHGNLREYSEKSMGPRDVKGNIIHTDTPLIPVLETVISVENNISEKDIIFLAENRRKNIGDGFLHNFDDRLFAAKGTNILDEKKLPFKKYERVDKVPELIQRIQKAAEDGVLNEAVAETVMSVARKMRQI